jgi:hypothetical protein
MKNDPQLGRTEALRRAMLAYLEDPSDPCNAYPAYWAPFVVSEKGRRGERVRRSQGASMVRFGSDCDEPWHEKT